jgi:hypothetical protein
MAPVDEKRAQVRVILEKNEEESWFDPSFGNFINNEILDQIKANTSNRAKNCPIHPSLIWVDK